MYPLLTLLTVNKIRGTMSLNNSVNIATKLRAGRPRFDSWRRQEFFSSPWSPDRLRGPFNLLSNGYRWFFPIG